MRDSNEPLLFNGSTKLDPLRPSTQGQHNRTKTYEVQIGNIEVIGGSNSIESLSHGQPAFITGVGETDAEYLGEKMVAAQVDKFKIIAVVDSKKTFSSQDCVFVNEAKNEVSHVCVNQLTEFKFDELVSSYDQVYKIGHSLAYTFTKQSLSGKVVLNLVDQNNSNNNCGFNLANFKAHFVQNYYEEVAKDYERSFIGAFSLALTEQFLEGFDLYLSISKFVGNMGFSLTQNSPDVVLSFGNDEERNVRVEGIMNQGAIPEFVRVRDMNEVYKIFVEANAKNKQIFEGQEEDFDLRNIKEDIILMQFKLICQDTLDTWNTLSFVNLPSSKIADVNMGTIQEVMTKQKRGKHNFMPYNKSILTRIIYDQFKEDNILTIGHFSKVALTQSLKRSITGYLGPAKGIFNMLARFGFEQKLHKQKISQQQALKLLEQHFRQDLLSIYGEIGKFREGLRSFEAYTQNQSKDAGKTMTMFHQMLYFLTLKEEMRNDAIDHFSKGVRQEFPSLLSDDQVQSVIFDEQYVNYLKSKTQFCGQISNISAGPNSGAATSKIEQLKQGKMKQFQYECIKSELKEEYERKVNQQSRKFNEKAQLDPCYMLMGQMTAGFEQPESVMHLRLKRGSLKPATRLEEGRDQQFQFYLDNAQKAIDLMRSKYKHPGQSPNNDCAKMTKPQSQGRFYRPQIDKIAGTNEMKVQRAISMGGKRTTVILRPDNQPDPNDDFCLTQPVSAKSMPFVRSKSKTTKFKFATIRNPELKSLQPLRGLKSMSGIDSSEKDEQIRVDDQLNFVSQQQLNPAIKQKNFNNYQSLRSQGALRHFRMKSTADQPIYVRSQNQSNECI